VTIALVDEAVKAGARLESACKEPGTTARTLQRWQQKPNGNHGLIVKGTDIEAGAHAGKWVAGTSGNALAFEATDWVRVKASPTLDRVAESGRFTIGAWIKSAANPAGIQWIAGRRASNSSGNEFGLGLSDGRPFGQVRSIRWTAQQSLSSDTWHHIVVVYDAQLITLFIDGAAVTEFYAGYWQLSQARSPFLIGAAEGVSSIEGFFRGVLDEVVLFSRALGPSEVRSFATR
jgi:hypothetical protein